MKTNTLRQRLAVYKKALKDYEERSITTYSGFCLWFYFHNIIELSEQLKEVAPEIYRFKPKKMVGAYWFAGGQTKPRIALLKKAIRYTESQIKKGKK